MPQFWIDRGIAHRSPGLVRAVAQLEFNDQTEESLSEAKAWLQNRKDWSAADVLDALLARLSPQAMVEKSPENVLSDAALKRMASSYPKARYLHLTRHPLTTQRSMQEHWNRIMPEYPQEGEPMRSIYSWYEIHRRILHFTDTLPPERHMQVKAEDILNEPEPGLRAIARWLQVSAEDSAIEAMTHPELSVFTGLGSADSGIIGGHDHGFLCDPIPRRVKIPPALNPPKGWVADITIWPMVIKLANRFGY